MSISNSELEEQLAALKLLLEGPPDGHDADLRTLLHKLRAFVDAGDFEPVEVAVQLLGTAVGGQSRALAPQ